MIQFIKGSCIVWYFLCCVFWLSGAFILSPCRGVSLIASGFDPQSCYYQFVLSILCYSVNQFSPTWVWILSFKLYLQYKRTLQVHNYCLQPTAFICSLLPTLYLVKKALNSLHIALVDSITLLLQAYICQDPQDSYSYNISFNLILFAQLINLSLVNKTEVKMAL